MITESTIKQLRQAYHEADAIYLEDVEDVDRFDELMSAIETVLNEWRAP